MNNNYPKQKKPIYVCAINYTKESNNIESIEKQIKLAKEFEPKFKELYNNLTQRFSNEFENRDFNEKIEFLEFLINEITESLIKAKNKFSLISESSINKVESLRDTFERELNKVYINNAETNKSSKKKPIPKFEDFFKDIEPNKIEKIKNKFKDLKAIELAKLIHLLVNEFKIIEIINSSKNGFSLKDFTKHFKNNNNLPSVQKHLDQNFIFKGDGKKDLIGLKENIRGLLS
jgi:oligoendopeptidase F